jgi:hypothetical protein
MDCGLGKSYLNPLGLIPDPLENSAHSLAEINFPSFLIAQQIKKLYSFLCASNKDLDILVNIILVILSFNLRIFN